jgi:hypothetical protein
MKVSFLVLPFIVGALAIGAADSLPPETSSISRLRRAPYKEVRTKSSQHPQIREARRKQIEHIQKDRLEERKRIEAQALEGRSKAATNKIFAGRLAKPSSAPKPIHPAPSTVSTNSPSAAPVSKPK